MKALGDPSRMRQIERGCSPSLGTADRISVTLQPTSSMLFPAQVAHMRRVQHQTHALTA
ncbi:hypothetical protein [Candidatus Palauibacter irciniicola]|uniref:hypothetical protein n=1 Tax=Candidatus Palauibacter irciniicola TaxID=3056733 RepID=UPI003B02E6CF